MKCRDLCSGSRRVYSLRLLTEKSRLLFTHTWTGGIHLSSVIMRLSFLEGGPIMYRCCPSVRPSVPCLHLERKRKGLGRPNLVGRVPGTRAPRGPIPRSKFRRSRSRRLIALLSKNPQPVALLCAEKYLTNPVVLHCYD